MKTTLGKLTMTELGSISRDAFPHRLDGMTDGGDDRLREIWQLATVWME